jgi:hypothetical protein
MAEIVLIVDLLFPGNLAGFKRQKARRLPGLPDCL